MTIQCLGKGCDGITDATTEGLTTYTTRYDVLKVWVGVWWCAAMFTPARNVRRVGIFQPATASRCARIGLLEFDIPHRANGERRTRTATLRCATPEDGCRSTTPSRFVGRERHHGIRLGVITGSGHNPNPLTLSYLPAECRATVDLPSVFPAAFRGVTKSLIRPWPYRR